ncbi:hypothetical protein [Thermoanaerobacter sp. YS13]|uniref:hypothetical protein n=1 Tax=Thermoanaerobacter sp. YS13 TaxID=1511746 RepID=UPI000AAD81E5|nr:hypothetical protein [Thermoanaerobacter sp. YS13]
MVNKIYHPVCKQEVEFKIKKSSLEKSEEALKEGRISKKNISKKYKKQINLILLAIGC